MRAVLILTAVLAAAPALAQDFFMGGTSPLALGTIQSAGLNARIGALSVGGVAARNAGRPPSPTPGPGPAQPAGTAYGPAPDLGRRIVAAHVARLQASDPAAAREVATQFDRHDYCAIYRGLIDGTGLADHDALDALTMHTVLNWVIANQHFIDPPPAAFAGVRRQLGPVLAGNPALANPGARAQLGEELKLLTVALHAGMQSARRDGSMRSYADAIAAHNARNGSNLRALSLTPQGFAGR